MPRSDEEVPENIKEARDRLGIGAEHRNANDRQVSGSHYGLDQFQHWDVVVKFDLDYFQGQITKYVMRWDKKNGVQDLKKAQHFLEKYIEEIEAGRITP